MTQTEITAVGTLRRSLNTLASFMAPRRKALPKPLPDGFILTDTDKKKWKLGKIIGQGGFGLICLASRDVDRPVAADTEFVIKLEYHENGPLFSELKFYQRAAKPESMQTWIRRRKLDFLGIPTYWGSGLAEYNDIRYRFMAMDRLGSDLQKICGCNGGRLKKSTVLQLGQKLVDVLEYIHENEYVHADIKAANLMLGYLNPEKVYLADYGLSYRYCPYGVHKEYKENPKRGHNGTIEYTSIDAHKGVSPSRRGDLQILGFCLLHWLCGSLPWDNVLMSPTQVQETKASLMDNLPDSVQQLSVSGARTDEVARFLLYVKSLGYQERPDYKHLKDLLGSGGTGRLDFSRPKEGSPRKTGQATEASRAKPVLSEDDDEEQKVKPEHMPARYIRGPPLPKPQSQQAGEAAVRSSPRLKSQPVEDDDDEEEKESRPKPIAACYLRGPPIGPRNQPEQAKVKSTRAKEKTDDLAVTSVRREVKRRLHPLKKTCIVVKCDLKGQTEINNVETWDERLLNCREGFSHERWSGNDLCQQFSAHRDSQWEESSLQAPRQEPGPILGTRLLYWSVFVCFCFFLLAAGCLL
ncbi:hypothetical protein LDENG_00166880 [Lucifuga dentata]|nr:hypothetical protein LDENG_00166880 [Lucifuga dentata]